MKLTDVFNKYLEETKYRKRPETVKNQNNNWRPVIKCLEELEIFELEALKYEDGQRIVEWFKNNTRSKNTTINKKIGYIKTALRHSKFMAHPFLLVDPLPRDTEPFVPMEEDILKQAIELSKIKTSENSFVYHAIYVLLYDTGCRINELLNIKKKNILLGTNTIVLESDNTKGKNQRYVFFTNQNKSIVVDLIRRSPSDYVFWNYLKSRPISRDDVKNYMRRMKKKLGVERFHAHQIRKRFATDLVECGANLKTVQTILGHKDQKTTEIYVSYSSIIAKKEYDELMNKKKSR